MPSDQETPEPPANAVRCGDLVCDEAADELSIIANDLAMWYQDQKHTMPPPACRAIRNEIDRLRSIADRLRQRSHTDEMTSPQTQSQKS